MWKDVHRKTAPLTTTPKHLRLQTGQQKTDTKSGSVEQIQVQGFFPNQQSDTSTAPGFLSLSPVTISRYLVAFCLGVYIVESGIGRPFEFCQNKMGEITYRRTCYLFAWVNQFLPSQRPNSHSRLRESSAKYIRRTKERGKEKRYVVAH